MKDFIVARKNQTRLYLDFTCIYNSGKQLTNDREDEDDNKEKLLSDIDMLFTFGKMTV